MKKLTALLGLSVLLFSSQALAQVGEAEIRALRAQIELLTKRLDDLERQNEAMSRSSQEPQAGSAALAGAAGTGDEAALEEKNRAGRRRTGRATDGRRVLGGTHALEGRLPLPLRKHR